MKIRIIPFVFIVLGFVLLLILALLINQAIESREAARQSVTRNSLKYLSLGFINFKHATERSLFDVASEFDLSWRVMLAIPYDDNDWHNKYKDFTKYRNDGYNDQATHELFEHPLRPVSSQGLTNFRAVRISDGYLSKDETRYYWIITHSPSKPAIWTSKNTLSQNEFEAEIAKPDTQTKFIATEDNEVMTVKEFYEMKRTREE